MPIIQMKRGNIMIEKNNQSFSEQATTDNILRESGIYNKIRDSIESEIIGTVTVNYIESFDILNVYIKPRILPDYYSIAIQHFDQLVINGIRVSYLKDIILSQYKEKLYSKFFRNE